MSEQPGAPVPEQAELREVLEDMVWQFGYKAFGEKGRVIHSGGLSALEGALDALGWDDPYIVPEDGGGGGCAVCGDWASAGVPTPDGYKWFCSTHYRAYNKSLGEAGGGG